MADSHKNFAVSLVATAPSPATSGTSLVVTAAEGALFPTVPFNATIWPAGANPLTTNAEIVRVTAIATDTLTITRAQEGSAARTVVVGDQIAATITAKTLTDVESEKADIANPTFTGVPLAPTAAAGTNTTQLATTAFVFQNSNINLLAYQALGSVIKGESVGVTMAEINTALTLVDGAVYFIAVYLPTPQTLTGIKFYQSVQGSYTADNNNYIGLYTYSGGTLTQVAVSTNNGNLWKATANSFVTEPFSSTYAAAAGLYFVGMLYNTSAQTTAPTLGTKTAAANINASLGDFTNSAKLASNLVGQTALPSSQAMSGLASDTKRYWIGLY